MKPIKDYRGLPDDNGSILTSTEIAIADEISSAADLVMGKTNRVGVALLRGYQYSKKQITTSKYLLRDNNQDLFNEGKFI